MPPPLAGALVRHGLGPPAAVHAGRLLGLLGAEAVTDSAGDSIHFSVPGSPEVSVPSASAPSAADPVADWAESGAMYLTGRPDGPPLVAPGCPGTAARGAALAVRLVTSALAGIAPWVAPVVVDGGRLLGERAALAGLGRRGDTSPGGSCRLVPAADGLLAVNLARPDDVTLLGAWFETGVYEDPWDLVRHHCRQRPVEELVSRAELLGLPVAAVPPTPDGARAPWRVRAEAGARHTGRPGLVVDLSSLWAGPLCANLLGLAGFEVVKVESKSRPDGARRGPSRFYDLLHGGHRSVALDFRDGDDVDLLGRLLSSADVVIESSRPRALEQLGLDATRILGVSPGLVWVSITGYGRTGPGRNRVAFGDDAAAAAGMIAYSSDGGPVFCGDALADPLSGLHAALAALAIRLGGCGGLVDVAMRDVVASTFLDVSRQEYTSRAAERSPAGGWTVSTAYGPVEVAEPSARPVVRRAAALGADTHLLDAISDLRP